MRIGREGVEVTAGGGLLLATVVDRRAAAELQLPGDGERYLRLADWRGDPDDYNRTRQALMGRIADAAEAERPRLRMELARFYFANGMGPEALGLLDILAAGDRCLEDRPDFALLRGASRVLAGDLEGALRDLTIEPLANSPEAALWRGAAAARAGDWQRAAQAFNLAGPQIGRAHV